MSEYFSIAALLIMFREALEASVIIAVLLQMLNKMKMQHLKRWVWFGALLGVAISVVLGIIFVLVFYLANTKLMSQNASMIFKGCICWIASILITVVAFAMLKFYNLERKWKRKLETEFSREKEAKNYKWSMFLLAGSATLREGIESVLFLTGTSAGLSVKSVIIPGIVGIVAGSLLGVLVYYSGHTIKSLKWFFIISSGLLMFIAAGMVINGTQFFSYAGLFGVMFPYELRPWSNRIVWNATSCCNPNTNQGWALLRALFGWQAAPTNLGVLYWGLYWVVTLPLLGWKAYNGTLTDRVEAGRDDLKSFARHGIQGDFDSFNSSMKDGSSVGVDSNVEKMLSSSSSSSHVSEGDANQPTGSSVSDDVPSTSSTDVEAGGRDGGGVDTVQQEQEQGEEKREEQVSASSSPSSWWKKTLRLV